MAILVKHGRLTASDLGVRCIYSLRRSSATAIIRSAGNASTIIPTVASKYWRVHTCMRGHMYMSARLLSCLRVTTLGLLKHPPVIPVASWQAIIVAWICTVTRQAPRPVSATIWIGTAAHPTNRFATLPLDQSCRMRTLLLLPSLLRRSMFAGSCTVCLVTLLSTESSDTRRLSNLPMGGSHRILAKPYRTMNERGTPDCG